MNEATGNRDFYDADSNTYDEQRWNTAAGAFTNRAQQQLVANLTSSWESSKIIEIGPGTGRFSIPLVRRQNRLSLVDISEAMLDVARGNIEKESLGEFIDVYQQGSIYELPFPDESFEHAISLNVFNHLENVEGALSEMSRVIRKGSTLLFNYANLQSYYWPVGRRINRQNSAIAVDVFSVWEKPAAIQRAIRNVGLDVVEMQGQVHVARGMEKYGLSPAVRLLDAVSRTGPLRRFAPIHYCLCRRPA